MNSNLTVTLDVALINKLNDVAAELKCPKSKIVRAALEGWLQFYNEKKEGKANE